MLGGAPGYRAAGSPNGMLLSGSSTFSRKGTWEIHYMAFETEIVGVIECVLGAERGVSIRVVGRTALASWSAAADGPGRLVFFFAWIHSILYACEYIAKC